MENNFHEKVISKLSFIQNWNGTTIKEFLYEFFFFKCKNLVSFSENP